MKVRENDHSRAIGDENKSALKRLPSIKVPLRWFPLCFLCVPGIDRSTQCKCSTRASAVFLISQRKSEFGSILIVCWLVNFVHLFSMKKLTPINFQRAWMSCQSGYKYGCRQRAFGPSSPSLASMSRKLSIFCLVALVRMILMVPSTKPVVFFGFCDSLALVSKKSQQQLASIRTDVSCCWLGKMYTCLRRACCIVDCKITKREFFVISVERRVVLLNLFVLFMITIVELLDWHWNW